MTCAKRPLLRRWALGDRPITGKEAKKVRSFNQGRFRQQVEFLRCQLLQDGELPFSSVLSEEVVAEALAAINTCWLDRIYPPLVTLWVSLSQVLSADHSCRAAVARLIAHRISRGQCPCSGETGVTARPGSVYPKSFSRTWLAEQGGRWKLTLIHSGCGNPAVFTSMTARQSR
jgi:hypothetical protein